MNSLHSGLQNKDTYYLNQFYLRISYSDKSYKKHPNTKLQQTSFLWISYRQWNFHPEEAHWARQWSLLQELLQSTPQAQCSHHKPHRLQFTLPHLQIINRKKNTHHTAFTAVDIREKKYKYSFHITHSTNWLTRYKTHLKSSTYGCPLNAINTRTLFAIIALRTLSHQSHRIERHLAK